MNDFFSQIPKNTGFPQDFKAPIMDESFLGKANLSSPFSDKVTLHFPSLHDFGGSDASIIATSNSKLNSPTNILRPGRALNSFDAWETERIKIANENLFHHSNINSNSFHWVIIRLNQKGKLHKIVIDTFHFENNSPKAFSLEGTDHPTLGNDNYFHSSIRWCSILNPSSLLSNKEQVFDVPVGQQDKSWTHVLLKIYPCGGISRVRFYGPLNASAHL